MGGETALSGEDLERRLHRGELPQMVDWFDPLVLGLVGIRTVISHTIGEYADQRPMQQVMDGDSGPLLTRRHDYSVLWDSGNSVLTPEADSTNQRFDKDLYGQGELPRVLKLDNKAMWVDFIADLGDGFEATYAMAYLLAADKLQVSGERDPLPAGQMLIFGGDLAYPNATLEEYRTRCVDPYRWAFTADQAQPNRELFFVAGNHDWYDGLSAFTHQFCYESESIGGWRCTQRRSYFAIRLPYNWWIWGVDVALGDSIDTGQIDYFRSIVSDMTDAKKKDDNADPKIVMILHAPDWTHPTYRALTAICEEAREVGEICAIIAGDLHHYSRYRSVAPERDPPLDLIVSGGGGAFTHPTHDLKRHLTVNGKVAGRTVFRKRDIRSVRSPAPQGPDYEFKAEKFYPSRWLSRLLALKNFWMPFHNKRFALLVGFIYFLYAWVFSTSVPAQFKTAPSESVFDLQVASASAVAATARASPIFFFMLLGLWVGLVCYVDAKLKHGLLRWLNGPIKAAFGTLHFLFHIWALLFVSSLTAFLSINLFDPAIEAALLNAKIVIEDLFSLSGTEDIGRDAFYIALSALTYAAASIVIGGVIGAFIFGCYWVVTSAMFGMHQDAFSALAIKDYKNFLKMKFEEDQLTIHAIAVDHVPGSRKWRAWDSGKDGKNDKLKHRPLLVTESDMKPRLIEKIVIKKGKPPEIAKQA
jgi:hypothetical protein